MSPAARSVFVFGVYMLGQGAILMLAPSLLLGPFGIPGADDPWVRVVGWALIALGTYYIVGARHAWLAMFRATVIVRVAQFGFFVALCATTGAPWVLVMFSAVELAAGVWTAVALRARPPGRAVA
jgi:hypothetical protein